MIDKDLIEAKFDIIETNLKFLHEFRGKTPKELEENYRDLQAVKYSLFEITESCIDIANHIIATKGLERVEEYAKMFTVLAKNKIISNELAGKLAKMAKFRNVLIHRYAEVKTEYLIEIIKYRLADIVEFMKNVRRLLK